MSDPFGSGAMFSAIAVRYDRLNRITSFGFDRRLRTAAVEALSLQKGARVLDLAAGTADLSLATVRRYPDCTVVACDPSVGMLRLGVAKIAAALAQDRIGAMLGCAENLPFSDGVFDAVIIGFGVRNFKSRETGFGEIRRVLKPGGRLVILELAMSQGKLLSPLARFYVRYFIPLVGRVLSSGAEYSYLASSMEAFPGPARFSSELGLAGFSVRRVTPFLAASCHMYVAEAGDVRG